MINQINNISNGETNVAQNQLMENELTALEDIIVTVGSTIEIDRVLERIVEVTANTIKADDLFIYLLDEENEDLILSAATKNQAYIQKGEFRMKVGEGVTGYVASTHEAYLIQEKVKQHERFTRTPELGDCNYESFLCVPIISKNNKLIGVMSIYSSKMHYFHAEHTQMGRRIALLVAGAIENAKLYELTNTRAYVLEKLANLSISDTPNVSTEKMIQVITEIVGDIFQTELALTVVYNEPSIERIIFNSYCQPVDESKEEKRLMQRNVTEINRMVSDKEINKQNIYFELEENIYRLFKNYISVKIVKGNETLGSIHCFSNKKAFSREDQSVLNLIANQASLIIRNRLLEERFKKTNEKNDFFQDIELANITSQELVKKLIKYDLNPVKPHAFIVIALSDNQQTDKDLERAFNNILETINIYTSVSLYVINNDEMVVLAPAADFYFINNLKKEIMNVQTTLKNQEIILTVGISQPTQSIDEYTTALNEAKEALKIGSLLYEVGGAYTLEDVSYYLYLSQLSKGINFREPYRIRVQHIAEYDALNHTNLFVTLKEFLEYGGNIKKVASNLYTHRNTIYKRLKKMEEITGMSLSNEKQWFPLQLALKVYELKNIIN